jgi:hypothetical protein
MASVPTKRTVLLYATGQVFVARTWDVPLDATKIDDELPVRLYHVKATTDNQAVMQALAQENREHRECDEQSHTAQTFYDLVKRYGKVFVQERATDSRQAHVRSIQVP